MLHIIKKELQHIIEALHSITNVDITIVDKNLERVVGTGKHSEAIGRLAPLNSAFHKCIETGEQYFIQDPRNEIICNDCDNKENCSELVEICLPISYKDDIIGVLGLCAFDLKAKENLMNNREGYQRFESQLTSIINSMLNEKDYRKLLEYRSHELSTLINSINEGIIIANDSHLIASANENIAQKLGIDSRKKTHLSDVLPQNVMKELIDKNFNGEIGPVSVGKSEYLIQSNPISVEESRKGFVLILSDFRKMKESVLNSSRGKEIVTFQDIIGESDEIRHAKNQALQVSNSDASVLILGDTGTGKEVFAKAIHYSSKRKNEIFVAINCGAIPENLIESELFGYEKGSFTGADNNGKMGIFEIAKNGTLFLDEIGELPYGMQVKLLRALEEKEITRVGGYKPVEVNPRIIAASHRDLSELIKNGQFREDLFYRLNIVPLKIPPLKDRGYDVLILARYFLDQFSKLYSKTILGFTPESERILLGYNFPGNIRELRNLIEFAVIFSNEQYIDKIHIESKMNYKKEETNKKLSELTKEFEREIILDRIKYLGDDLNSKKELARSLGISLATLYRKIEGTI